MAPKEEDIATFLTFVGGAVDRARAIRYLDNNAGNLEQAVSQYFEEPNKFTDTYDGWDESQFHTERDGSNQHLHAGSSFTIDAGTDHGLNGGTSGAPTRPPSRRSNYSNKSGGGGGQQESGTINALGQDTTGRQYFGPITRDASSYVENQWAMVPISTSTARVYENADVTERVRNRQEGEPVCFKPLRERDPLPSLITILGQIPKTRRELMFEKTPLGHYGSNPRWWDGEDANAGEPTVVQETDSKSDVVAETVRLMAFIQESNRSYGSVEQLERLPLMSTEVVDSLYDNGLVNNFSADVRFLVGWAHAATTHGSHESETLFKGVGVSRQMVDGVLTGQTDTSHRLDLDTFVSEPKSTIYQLLDRMMWINDRNGDSEDEYFLAQIPSVFVMRIENKHTTADAHGLGLQVPSSFYVDRYLQANVAATKQMRRERMQLQEDLAAIDERKNGLNQVPHPKQAGKLVDREDLFKQTIKNFRARQKVVDDANNREAARKQKLKQDVKDDSDEEMKDAAPQTTTKWADLADQLEQYHASIQEKLKDLDEQRQKIQQQITSLSAIFTENSASSDPSLAQPVPQAHYTLRGIGIGPAYETTFVYVDPQPSSLDPGAKSTDTAGQWWRFEYPSGGWDKLSKVRVTEEAVLKEASDEAKEALLVYADRSACDLSIPLPELNQGLRQFITTDSAGLEAELAEHSAAIPSIEDQWPDTAATTTYIDDISHEQKPALPPRSGAPPAYDDTQLHEHIPGLKVEAPDGQERWVPDLGPSVVSDEEYAANLRYEEELGAAAAGSGRSVSTMSMDMQGDREGGVDEYGRKNGGFNHW